MELWDIYDKYRQKTGRIHERGNLMNKGDYHIVVHVWIVNDKGEFLIQKRQPWKKGWPNMWDCAAAGSAVVGDSSKDAAIRETKEELGIDLDIDKGEILFTVKFSCGFDDIWFVRQNVDISDLKLQYEEVADAKWVSEKEIKQMAQAGEFVSFDYLDDLFKLLKDVYKKCPVFKKESITLKQTTIEDMDELLKCYSDKNAVKFFNSDNCNGDDFYYPTAERMKQAIEFWDYSYKNKYFVRWMISLNDTYEKIGTIEMFHRIAEDEFNHYGVLRIDLQSKYEKEKYIDDILEIVNQNFFELFDVNFILTKAVPNATERIESLKKKYYSPLNKKMIIYDNYFVRRKV